MAPLAGPVSAILLWVAILWPSRLDSDASGAGVATAVWTTPPGSLFARVAVLVAFGSDAAARAAIDRTSVRTWPGSDTHRRMV